MPSHGHPDPGFLCPVRILGNSIELRHAPFMLWINDLSAPTGFSTCLYDPSDDTAFWDFRC